MIRSLIPVLLLELFPLLVYLLQFPCDVFSFILLYFILVCSVVISYKPVLFEGETEMGVDPDGGEMGEEL